MAFGRKKTNWERIQKQDARDKLKYLDVYEDQQLERSHVDEKKSMTSRNILNGVVCFFAFLLIWTAVSLWDMAFSGKGGLEMSRNPADLWVHINEHYVNVDDDSDKITVDEYNALMAAFALAPKIPEVPNPGDPPIQKSLDELFAYDVEGHPDTPYQNTETGEWLSDADYEDYKANYNAIFAARMAKYQEDLTAYQTYIDTLNDPQMRYKYQKEHYRNAFNPEEYILVDEYERLVEEYETLVRRNKISDDEKSVPARPIKMADFYVEYEYGLVLARTQEELEAAGLVSTPDVSEQDMEPLPDLGGADPRDVYQWMSTASGTPWVNQNDGTRISDAAYEALCQQYDAEHGISEDETQVDNTPVEGVYDGTVDPRELYEWSTSGDVNTPWLNRINGTRISDAEFQALCDDYDVRQNPVTIEPPVQITDSPDVSTSQPSADTSSMNPRDVYDFDLVGSSTEPWVNKYTGERISTERMEALCTLYDSIYGTSDPLVESSSDVQAEIPDVIPDGMEYGPVTYRNKYDGSIITYVEYRRLEVEYKDALEVYKTVYEAHRRQYHPDDIDGTKKVFTMAPTLTKFGISFGLSALLFAILWAILKKNLDAENQMANTSDINQYHHDQHVALPEEVQRAYDWFPDVGAHSAVQVSSMISHMALLNKGLKKVQLARRADKDIRDSDGDIEYFKGEILMDAEGHPITETVPMVDEKFMEALFDASGALPDKDVRKRYDATKIPYNPDGSNRDKLGKFNTVADLINEDWEFPLYEPQRPGGAYIVDTAPVNTMVLAITRAGKGQTVIEPTLDMWMREKRPNNMVINDPKGELLVKNYVRATVRGLQVVQFNLINAMKTDIYNPLAMAADAAREGDNTKCAMYVENIAEVFFPLDGGEDPVWPNAANNAFKRAAYGLIDYYLEEEKAMRRLAERTNIDDKVLEQKIDEMWGKVTLYNCYQLFVQLSSKKMKNPAVEFSAQAKAGKFNDLSDEEYKAELERVKAKSALWEDKPDADLLTLFFSATDALPRNSMRTLVANANNALKAMGGADKMMASVYGIAITAMVRRVHQLKAGAGQFDWLELAA